MLFRKREGYVVTLVEATDVVCPETRVTEDVDETEELLLDVLLLDIPLEVLLEVPEVVVDDEAEELVVEFWADPR